MPPTPTDTIDAFLAAVQRAEAEALAAHEAGTCTDSEWSCSFCEAGR